MVVIICTCLGFSNEVSECGSYQLPAHSVDVDEAFGLRVLDAEDHEGVQDLLALDGVHMHAVVGRDVAVAVGGGGRQVLFFEDNVEVAVHDAHVVVVVFYGSNKALTIFGIMFRPSTVPRTSQKIAVRFSSLKLGMGLDVSYLCEKIYWVGCII